MNRADVVHDAFIESNAARHALQTEAILGVLVTAQDRAYAAVFGRASVTDGKTYAELKRLVKNWGAAIATAREKLASMPIDESKGGLFGLNDGILNYDMRTLTVADRLKDEALPVATEFLASIELVLDTPAAFEEWRCKQQLFVREKCPQLLSHAEARKDARKAWLAVAGPGERPYPRQKFLRYYDSALTTLLDLKLLTIK